MSANSPLTPAMQASPSWPHGLRHALLAMLLMWLCATMAWWLTPTRKLSEVHGKPDFAVLIPKQFGDWREEPATYAQIINPQQEEQLHRIYTQLLTRTYINSQGRRVMLSLAYGDDQRDGMQLHYPEVCYPAQGFMLLHQQAATLTLAGRQIPVKQLSTQLGSARRESVTYWTLLGETVFRGGTNKKLAEMRYGLSGLIADGLLFRVSSIEANPEDGHRLQAQFSQDLMAALAPEARQRLIGLN